MLDTKNYKVVEFSWQEKRQDLLDGVSMLPDALRAEAEKALDALKATEPAIPATIQPSGKQIETAHFVLEIDGRTGAITRLRNKSTGREWAKLSHFAAQAVQIGAGNFGPGHALKIGEFPLQLLDVVFARIFFHCLRVLYAGPVRASSLTAFSPHSLQT